jgi:hypothetical protein
MIDARRATARELPGLAQRAISRNHESPLQLLVAGRIPCFVSTSRRPLLDPVD